MGIFSGIGKAEVGQSRCYFEAGRYILQIKRVIYKDGRNGKFYIGEFLILQSDVENRPAGTSASWLQKMDGNASEVALGAIKEFLAACNGINPHNEAAVRAEFTNAEGEDITEDLATLSIDDSNPMAGVLVRLEAVAGSKKDGGPFTYHNWSPIQPGDETLAA